MEKCHIIKIGGKLIDDAKLYSPCISAFSTLPGIKILVHGGGKRGSEVLEKMDIPVHYHEGRRITDLASLEVVTMVYAGGINKQIVADLQSRNVMALGLSGCDLDIIRAEKRKVKDIDYGYAGDITSVDRDNLYALLQAGFTPVINPITHDGNGQLLNTNADTIAATIASALADIYSVQLHYCFEINGVMQDLNNPSSLIDSISYLQYLRLRDQGIIAKGMLPKMTNAFNALKNGVTSVTIGNHIHFAGDVAHTKLKMA